MSSFEIGASRPVGARQVNGVTGVQAASTTPTTQDTTATTASTEVATSDAVKAGEAPVDTDRVASIRKAVDSGTYPLIPTKIGDAMVAAGMLLRKTS